MVLGTTRSGSWWNSRSRHTWHECCGRGECCSLPQVLNRGYDKRIHALLTRHWVRFALRCARRLMNLDLMCVCV